MSCALTVAGSDSGGGAGIQVDLRTFSAYGVWGLSVVTALTAQNTRGVFAVEPVSVAMVRAQLEAVFSDFSVGAMKTGMLFSAELIEAVALGAPADVRVVVDPVMIAKGGASLLRADAIEALRTLLLPRAWMLTPNLPEAEALMDARDGSTGAAVAASSSRVHGSSQACITRVRITSRADMEQAASAIREMGPRYVLMKGGHLAGDECPDYLLGPEGGQWFEGRRQQEVFTHGTGCRLSAAIAAGVASGLSAFEAVSKAKTYLESNLSMRPNLL